MSTTDTQADTRQRILEAAGRIFADRGFHNATIREICVAAGANIAGVNYHFGDKEALYHHVLVYAGKSALEKYPIAGGLPPNSTPQQRLEAFIRNYLDRLLDEGRPAWHGKLIAREIFEPTRALDDLADHFIRPQYERLKSIVADLLGPAAKRAGDERLRLCAFSVVGQCLFYKHARPLMQRLSPEQTFDAAGRAELTVHITAFALAGIRDVRARLEHAPTRRGGGAS